MSKVRNSVVMRDMVFGMVVTSLFFSTPLFMTYLPNMDRLIVFFQNIEEERISFLWILRALSRSGLNELITCQIFLFIVNALTCFCAWFCFFCITGNGYVGLAGSICYSLSGYSMYIRYDLGALREAVVYAFLPLVLGGLYKIYKKRDKGIIMGIGLVGIFCSGISFGMDTVTELVQSHGVPVLLTVLWSWGVSMCGKWIVEQKKIFTYDYMIAVILINLCSGMYYMNELLYSTEAYMN